jgi:hypothetical protein
MADLPGNSSELFSSVVQLGKAVLNLVRAVEGKQPISTSHTEPRQDEAPAQLALPSVDAHSEVPQLLTQHTPGWHTPSPSRLPVPTYAPVMTAFGIVFIAMGAVTVWPLSVVGALIFFCAIAKWIGELLP